MFCISQDQRHGSTWSVFELLVIASLLRVTCQSLQTAAVKGVLFCGHKPAGKVKVRLMDADIIFDDLMDEGLTDNEGAFYLSGSESEITNIDPVLKIYHNCDDGFMPCSRRWTITIPSQYVTDKAAKVTKVFDIGRVNLECRIHEDRNCF
ncbi:unnamed protein product [Soboliphyme baturini]|uniref:Transthyretin-like protein 46 n=1 Tax=Soboliphyme baturini TaxID=241478 RepID=A0A183J9E4_9BILA|nr:unnamed protein product [Soboliphyme baturini]